MKYKGNTSKFSSAISVFYILIASELCLASEDRTSQQAEVKYAEAVLEYNGKNYSQAIKIADEILIRSPKDIQALELKALSLKSTGKNELALSAYQKLASQKQGAEAAPYYFEIGSIEFQKKIYKTSKVGFLKCVELDFNTGASYFYLGSIAFFEQDWSGADLHFSKSKELNEGELKIASHYYLGIVHSKNNYGSGAVDELLAAKDFASKMPESKTAQDIGSAASKALTPYDRNQWFGNVTVLGQYDGNVSLASSESTTDTSGQKSYKLVTVAGAGRMSSPMKLIQWVASLRTSYNKNFKDTLKEYEFLAITPALYLTYKPLARTHFGLKTEAAYTLQNRKATTTSAYALNPYSTSVEIGPYLRTEIFRKIQNTFETSFRPQKYSTDPASGTSIRSGNTITLKMSTRWLTNDAWINPDLQLGYEKNIAKGSDYKSNTISLSGGNSVKLPGGHKVSVGVSYSFLFTHRILPEGLRELVRKMTGSFLNLS